MGFSPSEKSSVLRRLKDLETAVDQLVDAMKSKPKITAKKPVDRRENAAKPTLHPQKIGGPTAPLPPGVRVGATHETPKAAKKTADDKPKAKKSKA